MPIKLKGSSSGDITLDVPAAAGTNTLTLPARTGNIITSADTGTVTGTMIGSLPAGSVIQVVTNSTSAYTTGTTTIPTDDTIPQNTEGTEVLTVTITPKSATSRLYIQFNGALSASAAVYITAALFQDSTASALAASLLYSTASGAPYVMTLTHSMISGTTSSTTFKVRIGPNSAATVAINGITASGRFFGGVSSTTLTITEVAV